jgi:REP element-mobilizing transposase RayT
LSFDNEYPSRYQYSMPRKARLDAPGAFHHIICRGIERRKIFYDDSDRDGILERLSAILGESRTACYAWALMPNHFHLLLKTGQTPMATLMRRLLTGYAVSFNRRHRRSGHLFQNRYKSILCQEDAYLLELVRYIHLNPLRAKIVADLKALDRYGYGGHSVLMGRCRADWQDTDYVLKLFGGPIRQARKLYREFVQKEARGGRRPELSGGGLVRSLGGWRAVEAMRSSGDRTVGDERILGDGDFVEAALAAGSERLERRSLLQAAGYDFERLAERVAVIFDMPLSEVLREGKYARTVAARSLFCYWANRELGITTVELSRRLNLAQPTVSQSVERGERVAAEKRVTLLSK